MGMDAKTAILEQKTALGIEFGSTRIKAVLIGADNAPIASGDHGPAGCIYQNGS